ncbi:MAG: helix-turn-helix domain-containing protein [Dehalococcoidia bacterium]|nr:helix-turn-helix domain-containing protein [Dehalococcoidia bacterium]
MWLTMRQKAFLSNLLDLYAEASKPLHYSEVAKTLGVGVASAYDMLRVLERKGMLRAEYSLQQRAPGPGRANILFAPTPLAHELFARLAADAVFDNEWEDVKARVLTALREKGTNYDELLREILAHMPQTRSPLAYTGEVLTALLLTLREAKQKFGPRSPLVMLLDNTVSKLGMSMLAGLAFGLSASHDVSGRIRANLPEYVRRYEAAVQELSGEKMQALRDFVGETVAALQAEGR